MAEKLDLVRMHKSLYAPSDREIHIVEVPVFSFLMINGTGDPNTAPMYQEALTALYGLAYTIKFAKKKETGQDFKVMPLEGLWWVKDLADLDFKNKDNWFWTMMIVQPSFITQADFETAQKIVLKKGGSELAASARFEVYDEGTSVQVLYLGAYADELPTVEKMHAFARQQGYELHKKHHEIYMSDPRRTDPEKLKTIIRQPVFKS
ncbi:MAG: GyrI-like domain-containing protein [Anaerolineaceae bacterium]